MASFRMADPAPRPVAIKQALDLAPEDAIAFFRGKGYRTTVNWSEMMHEEHERAFTVAKIARRDLLESVRRSLDKAMQDGTPFEQWQAQIRPELEVAGWWGRVEDASLTGTDKAVMVGPRRLRTIYDTNLRTARSAALWQRIQASKAFFPYLRYSAVLDRRTRPLHREWHGTVLSVDDPWWQTHFPPNGWRCRCTVIQVNDAMMKRRGWTVGKAPNDGPALPFRRPGSAAPVMVPPGIDPGFAYAPGSDYLRSLAPAFNEAELALPSRSAATVPMPTPRSLPADVLQPAPTGTRAEQEAAYLERWRAAVGQDAGRPRQVIVDPTGEPTVVDDGFWYGADGQLKIAKRDHGQFVDLIARTLQDPDEIWEVWDEHDPTQQRDGGVVHQSRLIRKLIARFDIDGRDLPVVVLLQVGKDGWYGVTSFKVSQNYIQARRNGTLTYRRGE